MTMWEMQVGALLVKQAIEEREVAMACFHKRVERNQRRRHLTNLEYSPDPRRKKKGN